MVLFIGLFSLVSVGAILHQSPTVDEPVHLLSGYASLKWSDYRANPEHPPLAKLWAALPLLAMDIKDPRPAAIAWEIIPHTPPHTTHTGSVAAKLFFVDNDGETLSSGPSCSFSCLRCYSVVLSTVGVKNCSASKPHWHRCFFMAWTPNIFAHSQIVHTDIAFTGLFFIGSYFFWRALEKLTWSSLALTACFFGLAAATKYAYLAMLAVWGALALVRTLSARSPGMRLGQASLRGWPAAESRALVRHLFLLTHRRLLHDMGSLRISL